MKRRKLIINFVYCTYKCQEVKFNKLQSVAFKIGKLVFVTAPRNALFKNFSLKKIVIQKT